MEEVTDEDIAKSHMRAKEHKYDAKNHKLEGWSFLAPNDNIPEYKNTGIWDTF